MTSLKLDDKNKNEVNFLFNTKINSFVKKCPLFLDADDEFHVLMFRRILELSLSQGRWSGEMSKIS
jgi:hypothetical protein